MIGMVFKLKAPQKWADNPGKKAKSMNCVECGQNIVADCRFCGNCGHRNKHLGASYSPQAIQTDPTKTAATLAPPRPRTFTDHGTSSVGNLEDAARHGSLKTIVFGLCWLFLGCLPIAFLVLAISRPIVVRHTDKAQVLQESQDPGKVIYDAVAANS